MGWTTVLTVVDMGTSAMRMLQAVLQGGRAQDSPRPPGIGDSVSVVGGVVRFVDGRVDHRVRAWR